MTIQQHASFDSSAAELNATSKLVKAWESKNAKNAAKAGGVSLMALSLAACGGSDDVAVDLTPFAQSDIDAAVAAVDITSDNAAAIDAAVAAVDITSDNAAAIVAALTTEAGVAHATVDAAVAAGIASVDITSDNAALIAAAVAAVDTTTDDAAAVSLALRNAAADAGVTGTSTMTNAELITAIKTANDAAIAAGVDLTTDNATAIDAAVAALGISGISTLAQLNTAYDLLVNPAALNEYLTTGTDNISGTANADTINGTYNNDGAGADTGTLNVSDSIAGGDESDTMVIVSYDEMTAALMPVLNSIETVSIQNALAGVGAHTELSSWAADATSIIVKGAQATELNDLAYATQTVTLSATSGDIVLDGTGAAATVSVAGTTGGELSIETATSATLNVTADSTIDDITSGGHDAATLTITGSGALTLSAVADATVTTINAADNTGGVTIRGLDFTNITSVTGTAANDTFGTTTAIVGTDTIAGGDGTDTLEIASAITAATLVTGIENVTVTATALDYEMEVVGATAITFATDGTSGGGADETGAVSDYDGSATITVSDVNIDDLTDDDEFSLDVEAAEDAAEGDADSVTVAIVTTQVDSVDDSDFIIDEINIVDEATGDENYEIFNVNVSGVRGVTLQELNLGDQGDTPVVNVNTSVALAMTGVTFETTTAGDDLGNTISFAGSTGAVTYNVGDLGYASDSDDVITGGSGSDTLAIDIANDDNTFTMSGVETLHIDDSNAGSLSFANVTGVTTIELDGVSTGDVTLTNIDSGTTVTVKDEADETANINAASAGSSVSVTYEDADEYDGGDTLSFGANVSTVSVAVDEDDTDVDEIDMAFAGNITLNITGDDSTDDVLALVLNQAATTTSVAINSTAVISYDASSDALDDDITVTFAGSTGAVSFTVAGDDLAIADTTLVGGSGSSDTLVTTLAAQSTAATVSGFETLSILDANGATVDLDDYTGVTTISLVDVDAGTLALNNVNGEAIDINTGVGAGAAIITVDSDTDGGGSLTLTMTASIADIDNEIIVTDFATLAFEADEDQDALYFDLDDDDLDTATFTGDSDIVMSTSGDMDVFETINILNAGDFDTSDTGNAAADTNFNLHSDNVDVDLDLAAGTSQTITFGSTLDTGDVVTITGFLEGSGVAADVLDLSALGLSGVGDLTFTDSSEDASNVADDSVTITSTEFAGSIVLVGTDADTVLAANLSVGDNFIF